MHRFRVIAYLLLCFSLFTSAPVFSTSPDLTPPTAVSLPVQTITATAFTSIGAAGYNDSTHELIIVGQSDGSWPGVDRPYLHENLLLTLRAAYDNPVEWPGVTIEFEPQPLPGHLPVYYFGQTEDTHHGQVTFEADRLLKSYSLGKDNVTGQEMTSSVPCYMSVLDKLVELQQQNYQSGPVAPQRFFFEPDMILEVTPDGTGVIIAQSKMVLKWAYIPPGTPNRTQNATDAADYFVDCFNSNYDTFAAEQATQGNTALYELRVLGEIAALAKWIQDRDLDSLDGKLDGIHYPWLSAYANVAVVPTTTISATPAITVSKTFTIGPTIITQSLYGGVDMGPPNTYQTNPNAGQPAAQALAARPPSATEWSLSCPLGIRTTDDIFPLDLTCGAHAHLMSKEVIRDNLFNENPPGQWQENSPFEIVTGGQAILGGYNNAAEKLKQQNVLPSASTSEELMAASATPLIVLTFDWGVGPVDPNPVSVDFLYVRLRRANGTLINTVHTISNRSTPVGIWQTASFDVSTILQPYLGQSVELSFESQTNGSGITTFYLDNVFLDTNLQPKGAPHLDQVVYLPLVLKNAGTAAMTTSTQLRQKRPTQYLSVPSRLPLLQQTEPGSVLRYHLEE
jgi:hypothetical protein